MHLKNLVLSVLVMLIASACSTTPSKLPTVKRLPPQSCLSQCDPLPFPLNESEQEIRNWEYLVIETFGLCRRLHADCVTWVIGK